MKKSHFILFLLLASAPRFLGTQFSMRDNRVSIELRRKMAYRRHIIGRVDCHSATSAMPHYLFTISTILGMLEGQSRKCRFNRRSLALQASARVVATSYIRGPAPLISAMGIS